MKRSDFRFRERLRVRWAEVDMQKIVFNGHYLMYVDTAVAGYWRALAMPYHETLSALDGDLFVRKATLEYEGSARYDEVCEIGIRCARIGNSSLVFSAAVFRGEQRLVHGELVYVFADPSSQTSRPVPAPLRAALDAFEAGDAMLALQVGGWSDVEAAARALRAEVFVDEMRLPARLAGDDSDLAAVHAVARNRFGMPVATGRLRIEPDGQVALIGRLAVRPAVRGGGAGRAVLDALLAAAAARGCREVRLHAEVGAVGFYVRAGFVPYGAVFEDAGVAHQTLRRSLA